jgi:hypothetical protein
MHVGSHYVNYVVPASFNVPGLSLQPFDGHAAQFAMAAAENTYALAIR